MASATDKIYVEIIAETKKAVAGFATLAAGVLAAYKAFQQVGQFLADSIKEYLKAEEATTKLSAALRAQGEYSGLAMQGMIDLSSQLQQVTRYGDDVTQSAAAMLMSLGGLSSKMTRDMIPTVQDFASAMGMDLENAAALVAKAIEGNVGALSRYGIKIEEGLDKQGRMVAITEKLGEKFGGLAIAMGDTAGGALAKMSNAFGDMREEIGRATITALKPLVDWLGTITTKITAVMTASNDLKTALANQSKGVADVSDKIILANDKYNKLRETYVNLTDTIWLMENVEIAMQMAWAAGYKTLDQYTKAIKEQMIAARLARDAIEQLAAREQKAVEAEADRVRVIEEFLARVKEAYARTADGQRIALEKEIAYWESSLKTAGVSKDKIIAILKELREQYEKTYGGITMEQLSDAQRAYNQDIENGAVSMDTYNAAMWILEQRALAAAEAQEKLDAAIKKMIDLMEAETGVANPSWANEDQEAMALSIADAAIRTADAAERAADAAKEIAEANLADEFKKMAEALASEAIVTFFASMGEVAAGTKTMSEAISEMVAQLAASVGQMMVSAGLQLIIANAYNPGLVAIGLGLIAAGGVAIMAGAYASASADGGGGLPRMAAGGIVTRPTLALIGEAGPEAVVPLGRGAGGTTIIVQGSIWQTEDLARAVANAQARW